MHIESTVIEGVFVVHPARHHDERGYFARVHCQETFLRAGIDARFVQVNAQFSPVPGTLRGLHFQRGDAAEIKYARCIRGRVWDVAVDLRPGSPTLHRYVAVELDSDVGTGLVVGRGCAHGFVTLEPDSEVVYMTDRAYAPDAATGVRWNDPAFGIDWPVSIEVTSERDAAWPLVES
jgi:dTDP-4-dehydrorhamnose 3,5-epimerase